MLRGGQKSLTLVRLPDGRSAVRKERPQQDAAERLRREGAIIERLAGLDGVPRLLAQSDGTCLLLADVGGVALLDAVRPPVDQAELLELALALARILAGMHCRGVIHKDVNPANIMLCRPDGHPVLVDFDLATTFAEERPGFTHQSEITGTLAYLAPEQTGRTGRPVDQRADLYALGATLYELATGAPPFGAGEPLQLIHDHLARVPVAPGALNTALRPDVSDLILRLLEKEPDRRYQSAEGLAHDLEAILGRLADGGPPVRLGAHDFAPRLSPPSRLVGRDAQIGLLRSAFEDAVRGLARGVLVAGGPGVGKTALINELRPIVTAGNGWFVIGKFDRYRRDRDSDAVTQALRALGRLLLAEPEHDLDDLRDRLAQALGANAGLIAASLPEFAVLLRIPPGPAAPDPIEHGTRLLQGYLDLLRVVASPAHPVVIVIDDLQWAGTFSIGLADAVLVDANLPGVLLVGAYRDAEVDQAFPAHPLAVARGRWERLDLPPAVVTLGDLAGAELATFVGEMLRLAPDRAAALAGEIRPHTGGNPYDTVELINALRRDGGLVLRPGGWDWDPSAIRGHIGHGDVVDLIVSRIAALPPATRRLLTVLACLGGEVDLGLLRAANGRPGADLAADLLPALEDGLLIMEQERGAVRFRHDRVQQAAYSVLDDGTREEVHLRLARTLAANAGFDTLAAEQYLMAVDALSDPAECHRAIELFRVAASALRLTNGPAAERFLTAAGGLIEAHALAVAPALRTALSTELHATLYLLGRLTDADEIFQELERLCGDPLDLVEPTCVQIYSLTNRHRPREAVELGERLLGRLGVVRPPDISAMLGERLAVLTKWAADVAGGLDARPEVDDPRLAGVGKILEKMLSPAFFCDQAAFAWIVLESHRRWLEHGPSVHLMAGLGRIPTVVIALAQDYRTAYTVAKHVLAVGEARGYVFPTVRVRYVFAGFVQAWFEPLEANVALLQRVREDVMHSGDVQYACFAYDFSIAALLDCGPSLDAWTAEIDAGLALAERTNNEIATLGYQPFRQLARALRGDTDRPDGSFDGPAFAEAEYLAGVDPQRAPVAAANFHAYRALSAAIFDDAPALARYSATAVELLKGIPGIYTTATVHLVRCLAGQLDSGESHEWLKRRAQDAPGTFGYQVHLAEAERLAATGDLLVALQAFERALESVRIANRPLHRAFVTERAGRTHLAAGLAGSGRALMREAVRRYASWGAEGKVAALRRAYPFLQHAADDRRAASAAEVSADAIDLMAVLEASRALSSETNLARLRDRVVEVLGALTGATAVRVLLWNDDEHAWFMSTPEGDRAVEEAASAGLVPITAFRYAVRTREALLVADAVHDGRFARDGYFHGLDACSLLVMPILVQGQPRAILFLENRLSRGAFSADRLDTVNLIAGQLAVSLDNALLYASTERKVAERTEALAAANARLELLSVTDPLTGAANRRRFADHLQVEWRRAERNRTPLAIAMIDIDQFKPYNDYYGHPGGDACLSRIATVLRGAVRSSDLVARYGGEEFAIVLAETDLAAAQVVTERVRVAVEGLDEPHAKSALGHVTISVGVAAHLPHTGGQPEKLVEAADIELYKAKRHGRNIVWPPTIPRRAT